MSAAMLPGGPVDVLIVGGGIFGCSIAWHCARLGVGRVVVLERDTLAFAATSRAAALMTRARAKPALMPLVAQTYADLPALEEEIGESLDLRRVGSLHIAGSAARRQGLRELAALAETGGLSVEWLAADEAARRAPWLDPEAILAAAFMPEDGFIDPYRLAMAYARAARARGAILLQGIAVRSLRRQGERVTGAATAQGAIEAGCVVDAAGAWSALLASSLGIGLPLAPVRSQYWITAPDPQFPPDHAIVILPDVGAYSRPELGGLLFGLREARSASYDARQLPPDLSGFPLGEEGGWPSLIEGAPALRHFLPALDRLEIAHHIAGLSTYTPDALPVLGPAPETAGFLAASGCSGAGIALAGGVGASIAALAANRARPFDVTPFRLERFGPINPFSPAFRRACEQARSSKVTG
ncbi:MAG: FAD-binding oxidoreductase [Candidatus Competibacteraceae bacterium]|nr:FAD-binding oxidoreductase [Candidatus Competibacteraceae bacterium]